MSIHSRHSIAVGLWLGVGATSCATTRFVASDDSYEARPATADPQVFVYGMPTQPYRVVGFVEATSEDGLTDGVLQDVRSTGRAAGCELLVDDRLVPRNTKNAIGALVWVHRTGSMRDTVKRLERQPPPPQVYRFGCGRWEIELPNLRPS